MNYKCTRNQNSQVTAAQAIVQELQKDGGLFVPETLPQYTHKDFVEMQNGTYIDRAVKVLSDFCLNLRKRKLKSVFLLRMQRENSQEKSGTYFCSTF